PNQLPSTGMETKDALCDLLPNSPFPNQLPSTGMETFAEMDINYFCFDLSKPTPLNGDGNFFKQINIQVKRFVFIFDDVWIYYLY
ncbi:MAG: hypothetical protein AAGM40_13850, partial [Cyanobacteria bacterium J06573_2]